MREYLIALSDRRADVPVWLKIAILFMSPWVGSFAVRCLGVWLAMIPIWGRVIAAIIGYVGLMLIVALIVYWRAVWRDFRQFAQSEL